MPLPPGTGAAQLLQHTLLATSKTRAALGKTALVASQPPVFLLLRATVQLELQQCSPFYTAQPESFPSLPHCTQEGELKSLSQAEQTLHRPALALPLGALIAAVTTPADLTEPIQVSQQGPATPADAFPDQAEDTNASHQLASFNTGDEVDTIPDVPDRDGFLQQFPELSEYVVQGGWWRGDGGARGH